MSITYYLAIKTSPCAIVFPATGHVSSSALHKTDEHVVGVDGAIDVLNR